MKEFFVTLRESIWSQKFYAVMGSRSPRDGVRYFTSLMFFASFVTTVIVSIFLVPAAIFGTNLASRLVAEHYPANLVINFKNGIASTTPAKVYKLPTSTEIWSADGIARLSGSGISNILVIDTGSRFENIDQFNNAKTLALLTRDSIVFKNSNGFEVKSLKEAPNITITKSFIERALLRLSSSIKYIIPILIVLGFIMMFVLSLITYIVALAIAAVLMWLIGTLAKRKGDYREFFTTALYAVTLPVLLDLAFLVLGRPNGMHFLTTVLLIVLVWMFNVKIWQKANLLSTNVTEPPTTT